MICGKIGNVSGPVTDIIIQPEYLDVSIPPDGIWTHPVKTGKTLFAYVISGKAYFDSDRDGRIMAMRGAYDTALQDTCMVEPESVVLYENGESVEITASDQGVRFLLISGNPLREPIAWHGPIVMNTDEELVTAFREYREGSFIKFKG